MSTINTVKVLPWGEKIMAEFSLNKKSSNKFYARYCQTPDGRDFIEFTKFGPRPNSEGQLYNQKLRIFSPVQWLQLKKFVEEDLLKLIGWDMAQAKKDLVEFNKEIAKFAPVKEKNKTAPVLATN